MAIEMMITTAGLDALVDAQAGETTAIEVVEVGFTASAFTMAPTVTALPGEIKRIDTIGGTATSETVIHMTAQDSTDDVYDLRGIGLYLTDGTLFAIYSQPSPLFRKVSIAAFLFALDLTFAASVAGDIHFGDATFLIPPASETVKGVAKIATTAATDEGSDDESIVTPFKLKRRLDALATALGTDISGLADALFALLARTITGGGLVGGGGNLSASRVLTVNPAFAADVAAGTATDRAVTPAALSGLARSLGASGYCILPGTGGLRLQWGVVAVSSGVNSVTFSFPVAFANTCFRVFPTCEQSFENGDESDEPVTGYPVSASQGVITVSGDHNTANVAYFAIGV